MTNIIDCRKIANDIKEKLKKDILNLRTKPKLVIINIGNDLASKIYIRNKERVCNEIGITLELITYSNDINTNILESKINELNNNNNVHGIIIQLPLPKHLNSYKIINLIVPIKDVDGLTSINLGNLVNNLDCIIPCTPLGIIKILESYKINIKGKNIVILGRSNLVGKPLFHLLLNKNATVTICHSQTKNIKDYTLKADILIIAIGKPNYLKKDMIKAGSIIIDVGINQINKKIFGDVDINNVIDKCSYITKVPNGVGKMTVIMLLCNTINSYKKINNID